MVKETSRIEPDPAANAGTEHSRTCAEARSEEPSESASKIDLQGELLARSLKDQEEHLLLKRILQTRRLDEEDSSKELQTIRRHARAARHRHVEQALEKTRQVNATLTKIRRTSISVS